MTTKRTSPLAKPPTSTKTPSSRRPSSAASAEATTRSRRSMDDGEHIGEIVACLIRLDLHHLWREDEARDAAIAAFMSGFRTTIKSWEDGPEFVGASPPTP